MLSTLLALGLLFLGYETYKLYQEKQSLFAKLSRYGSLLSKEEMERKLELAIIRKENQIISLQEKEEGTIRSIEELESRLHRLEEEDHLQELGFYEPVYYFSKSEDYQLRFDQITAERKSLIRSGKAAFCSQNWVVNNDPKKGSRMIRAHLKVILEAFDSVCDSAVNEAKTGNIQRLKNRINKSFERLNKSSQVLQCQISEEYLRLRVRELEVKYEMEFKKEEERERNRYFREKLRREKKEREDIEKAKQDEENALEQQKEYEQEIEKIKLEMQKSIGKNLQDLECKRKEYEALINRAKQDQENAISRYRSIKSGVIYVVSNEGSLGEGVYRVFVTQSGEPDRYIKNMNPYVPFPFIIHLKAYTEDASDSIERIHNLFLRGKVNKVNPRRDFFRVPLQKIKEGIRQVAKETGLIKDIEECEHIPIQDEYVRSLGENNQL